MPECVIIIPNYNGVALKYKGKPVIKTCLDSINKSAYKNYKIIVTDDHSYDESVQYLKIHYKYLDILKNNVNLGYEKNVNKAIRYAFRKYKFDYLILLNSDVIITDRYWINKLKDIAKSQKDVGLIGCKLIYPNGKIQKAVIRFNDRFALKNFNTGDAQKWKYNSICEAEVIEAAMHFIKRETIEKIGLLDENLVNGYDDEDYCLRVKENGLKVIYDGKLSIIHLQNFTLGKTKNSKELENRLYSNMRNRFYFLRKHRRKMTLIQFIGWHVLYTLNHFVIIKTKKNEKLSLKSIGFKEHVFHNFLMPLKAFLDAQRLNW